MNNWKAISQIAALSGIVFIIFAALTAFINYQAITIQYSTFVPPSFIQISTIASMLPFIMLAVVSFVVAAIGSRAAKETIEKETQPHTHSALTETTV